MGSNNLRGAAAAALRAIDDVNGQTCSLASGVDNEVVALPPEAVDALRAVLRHLAAGDAVTITAARSELTTQQAAELLDVSRPFLIKLLQEGRMPFRRVGAHRRVLLADVLAFKREDDALRRKHLAALVAESEALGLYEDE